MSIFIFGKYILQKHIRSTPTTPALKRRRRQPTPPAPGAPIAGHSTSGPEQCCLTGSRPVCHMYPGPAPGHSRTGRATVQLITTKLSASRPRPTICSSRRRTASRRTCHNRSRFLRARSERRLRQSDLVSSPKRSITRRGDNLRTLSCRETSRSPGRRTSRRLLDSLSRWLQATKHPARSWAVHPADPRTAHPHSPANHQPPRCCLDPTIPPDAQMTTLDASL